MSREIENIIIDIDYDESNQLSYNGFIAKFGDHTEIFNTNDPTVDYIDCLKWCEGKDNVFTLFSSAIGHFVSDGDQYKFIYIDHNNDNKFIDDFTKYSIIDIDNFTEYIVHKDINSFEEHHAYYKSKKII